MLYIPAPPAQPALALAPVGIVSSAPALVAPIDTVLKVQRTSLNVLDGQAAAVTGALRVSARLAAAARLAGLPGRIVALQALGHEGWSTIARTRTGSKGRFRLRYVARWTGSERLRLRFAGAVGYLGSHRRLGQLNVYRLAEASWYGGGGGLACGGTLTSSTMGVANKTLPCGTLVTFRYGDRSVRVPVVDRGPYVAGREFDLTEATKQALGFGDTGEVWSTR